VSCPDLNPRAAGTAVPSADSAVDLAAASWAEEGPMADAELVERMVHCISLEEVEEDRDIRHRVAFQEDQEEEEVPIDLAVAVAEAAAAFSAAEDRCS